MVEPVRRRCAFFAVDGRGRAPRGFGLVMTIESMTEVLRAHLGSRGIYLADSSGKQLLGMSETFGLRELAEVARDAAASEFSDEEPTREIAPNLQSDLRAASKYDARSAVGLHLLARASL